MNCVATISILCSYNENKGGLLGKSKTKSRIVIDSVASRQTQKETQGTTEHLIYKMRGTEITRRPGDSL